MKIKRIEHIAVAVEDMDFMAKLLGDKFGLDLEYTEERVATRIGMLPVGETYIELLQGVTPESGATKWLKEKGQSLFHICFEVEDIDECRAWLAEHSYRITYEYDSRQGNDAEQRAAVFQLVLDPAQWFGFNVTLMKRYPA